MKKLYKRGPSLLSNKKHCRVPDMILSDWPFDKDTAMLQLSDIYDKRHKKGKHGISIQ